MSMQIGHDLDGRPRPQEGAEPDDGLTAVDVFAFLFAQRFGRMPTPADRLVGEAFRSQAAQIGWELRRVPKQDRV